MDMEVQEKILQNHTLDSQPIETLNLQLPLQFEVIFSNNDGEKKLLPFYTLNTRTTLIRKDFLEAVLAIGESGIKVLDAIITERHSGREHADFKFITMEKIDLIDRTKKNYWEVLIVLKTGDPAVQYLHMFYINDTSILVDENAKRSIEKHNINGIIYYDPEKYAGL
jgi:hypothetical protein